METKAIIGKNIQELRIRAKLTQYELASKLNYSDKAISKWERGESAPDPDVMLQLSKLFNVQIDYFYYLEHQEQYMKFSNPFRIKDLLFTILMCITALTLSTAVFLLGCFLKESNARTYWIAFIYALPIMSLFFYFYCRRIGCFIGGLVCISIGMWTMLTTVFLQMLIIGIDFWMIFLIGLPFQAALIVFRLMKN